MAEQKEYLTSTRSARESSATEAAPAPSAPMRNFETGATRNNSDQAEPDYEGFLSPLVIHRYGEYMHKHRVQANGKLRDSDNWQRGIPLTSYIKSMWRHFLDIWLFHRGGQGRDTLEDALCALMFNAMGYLHELLKTKDFTPTTDWKPAEHADEK